MDKNTIVVIVLLVLVVFSVVQAFQINGLKDKVSSGGTNLNVKSTSSGGVSGAVPSNLKDLPQMVGGC